MDLSYQIGFLAGKLEGFNRALLDAKAKGLKKIKIQNLNLPHAERVNVNGRLADRDFDKEKGEDLPENDFSS